jgi:hypothetical protein
MYSLGLTTFPLWPTWSVTGAQPSSQAGLLTKGTSMKIMTFHPFVIVVEGFYASASEIRRPWDTSPYDGTGD